MILTFTADKMVHLEDFQRQERPWENQVGDSGKRTGLIVRGECAKNKKNSQTA